MAIQEKDFFYSRLAGNPMKIPRVVPGRQKARPVCVKSRTHMRGNCAWSEGK